MIVIDYSGTAIANIMQFQEDLKAGNDLENLIRHVILSTIKSYKKRFKGEYGNDIVIACDASENWRKEVFPHYKHKRKKAREESDIPWSEVFRYMDLVREELKEFFPYKVIQKNRAEADDIMAVMAIDIAATKPRGPGLFDDPEPTLIISSDKDMSQLLAHDHVRQYLPRDKKFVKLEDSPRMFLRKLILTGDSGDGIPNVFSPNDAFVTGTRQSPATAKKMAPMLEAKNMADAAPNETVKARVLENAKLIAFSFIPEDVKQMIIEAYHVPVENNKMTVLKYLMEKDMKNLIKDVDEF